MGDLLEFTTSPTEKRSCYMIPSGALKFHVKGSGSAAIGLANKPNKNYVYEIIIGNQYSTIDCIHKVKTVNIISEHTYRPFWITWYGSEIRIGKGDNPKPFIVEEELLDTINYISFLSFKQHTMYWKFRLPPKIKEPIFKNIDDGPLKWVKMDGNCLPEDALIGGYEDEVLYIMRAMHEVALTPGKFVPSKRAGYVAWECDAHEKTDMEILCGYNGVWVQTTGGRIPPGALVGGFTEYHETMYVGRAFHDNIIIPGKVASAHKACYIPYNGREIAKAKYEILINLHFSNKK